MQNDIITRPMQFDDLDAVYKIERSLFPHPWPKVFFERDLESANIIALVTVRLSDSTELVEGSPKGEHQDNIIGYALATYEENAFHITNIAVDKRCQNQGIATKFMAELEKEAEEIGCTFVHLEVRKDNVAAINLYKKLGYSILHTHKLYYINGDDAYIMHKEL